MSLIAFLLGLGVFSLVLVSLTVYLPKGVERFDWLPLGYCGVDWVFIGLNGIFTGFGRAYLWFE